MKPFDLEAALAGEPVILRNGSKGYVKYVLPYSQNTYHELQGYYEGTFNNEIPFCTSWHITGAAIEIEKSNTDIVGMWEEPKVKVIDFFLEYPNKPLNSLADFSINIDDVYEFDRLSEEDKYEYIREEFFNCFDWNYEIRDDEEQEVTE